MNEANNNTASNVTTYTNTTDKNSAYTKNLKGKHLI